MNLTFVGTTTQQFEADPQEYAGLTRAQTELEIRKTLSELSPEVTFWGFDIEVAADALYQAAASVAMAEVFNEPPVT